MQEREDGNIPKKKNNYLKIFTEKKWLLLYKMKTLKEKINLEDNVLGFVFYGLIFISIGLGIILKTLTKITLFSGIFLMVIGFISLIIKEILNEMEKIKNDNK